MISKMDFLGIVMAGMMSAAPLMALGKRDAPPNIVYILADDLGYGDVQTLNPEGKIPTPQMDRMAKEGMTFTDAHSGSAVCTPTRYGIITGRYCWRSTRTAGVNRGYNRALIPEERMTVASYLKANGYHTAYIGKWHVGWNWATKNKMNAGAKEIEPDQVDFSKPITNGPKELGFDYSFGYVASLNHHPFVWVENGMPTMIPKKVGEEKGKSVYRSDDFVSEKVLQETTTRGAKYIAERATTGNPFFLYLPLPSPHTPILPTGKWQGASKMNRYADYVMQTDDCVGQILDAVEQAGIAEKTLIIMTSDNGCSHIANYDQLAKKGHNPSAHFRGKKSDLYEGGHRVPFFVKWSGTVKAGSTCDQIIGHEDLFRTCSELVGVPLPDNAGEDSVSFLPALKGAARKPIREAIVHAGISGRLAIRQGKWKMLFAPGSGGWSDPKPNDADKRVKKGEIPRFQLYDMENDVQESTNVIEEYPEVAKKLYELMNTYYDEGRSTPGAPQKNDSALTFPPRVPK